MDVVTAVERTDREPMVAYSEFLKTCDPKLRIKRDNEHYSFELKQYYSTLVTRLAFSILLATGSIALYYFLQGHTSRPDFSVFDLMGSLRDSAIYYLLWMIPVWIGFLSVVRLLSGVAYALFKSPAPVGKAALPTECYLTDDQELNAAVQETFVNAVRVINSGVLTPEDSIKLQQAGGYISLFLTEEELSTEEKERVYSMLETMKTIIIPAELDLEIVAEVEQAKSDFMIEAMRNVPSTNDLARSKRLEKVHADFQNYL